MGDEEMLREEERAMEIEALQAIYGDDFTHMDYSPHHFFIRIRSPPSKYLPDEASVILDVAFTPYYPNELPLLTIQGERNVTPDDAVSLQDVMLDEANRNIGSAMIYSVAQRVKECIDEKRAKAEPPKPFTAVPVCTQPEAPRPGTPVIPETFNKWWQKFLIAHPDKNPALKQKIESKKYTGRQLFERDKSLVTSDAVQDPTSGTGVVDWSLFGAEGEEEPTENDEAAIEAADETEDR